MTILRIFGFVEPVGPLHRRRVRTEDGRGGAPMDQMMNVIVVNSALLTLVATYWTLLFRHHLNLRKAQRRH